MSKPIIDHRESDRLARAALDARTPGDQALFIATAELCRSLERVSHRVALLIYFVERSTPVGPDPAEKERPSHE